MRIKIDGTITIAPEKVAEARAFMQCNTNQELADAIRDEAIGYVAEYLRDNIGGVSAVSAEVRIPGGGKAKV